jgi:hypothetical protein
LKVVWKSIKTRNHLVHSLLFSQMITSLIEQSLINDRKGYSMNATKMILILALFYGAVCDAHDVNYYRLHPDLVQKAMEGCPAKNPSDITCDEFKAAAIRINELSYQLRSDPQGYGKKILSLQEQLTLDNKQELQEYLAIVKWLESPEGA